MPLDPMIVFAVRFLFELALPTQGEHGLFEFHLHVFLLDSGSSNFITSSFSVSKISQGGTQAFSGHSSVKGRSVSRRCGKRRHGSRCIKPLWGAMKSPLLDIPF